MFKANILSLSSGVSYSDVDILEDGDLPSDLRAFGPDTLAFYANGALISCHIICLRVCQIDLTKIQSGSVLKADRIILDKDISYDNCTVYLDHSNIDIPDIIQNHQTIIFTHKLGTVITLARNVVSLILNNNRIGGTEKVVPIKKMKVQREDTVKGIVAKIKRRSIE